MKKTIQHIIYSVFLASCFWTSCFWTRQAFAFGEYYEEENAVSAVGLKGHIFELITGAFGALVIVVCGLGGFLVLMMMRQGRAGKNAPVLGIVLLCIAATVFVYRILIISGFMGHDYVTF